MSATPRGWAVPRRLPPSDRVPPSKGARNLLRARVEEYVRREGPVPPLSMEELRAHAGRAVNEAGMDARYRDFAAVLLNNAVWCAQVAAFPFSRRLLLLPKCLRDHGACTAAVDPIGLICRGCGRCPIADVSDEAERLGYAVMVAEGSPVVMSLVESGKIDAVVGVSCLSVLEKVFPYMEAGAVPGIAVPLLNEGCADTAVDLDWVWDAVHLARDGAGGKPLDLERLKHEVEDWFTVEALAAVLDGSGSAAETVALAWLAKAGKRWRPFLAAAAYQALAGDDGAGVPDAVRRVAIAVECFHKASLIHDDIEDGDALRYGEQTLHEEHGVPVALNAGDLLIGEGYRLIARCGAADGVRAAMLEAAAEGHRTLSIGQGAELAWMRSPRPLAPADVLEIFRRKTAPAFEVALRLGALLAGAGEPVMEALRAFSEAIGVAYQVRDDLEDFSGGADPDDAPAMRPSILFALAYDRADAEGKRALDRTLSGGASPAGGVRDAVSLVAGLGAAEAAGELLDLLKSEAIRALCRLENSRLKSLLRRVVGRIFNEVEFMGCCDEHQRGDATSGAQGVEAA